MAATNNSEDIPKYQVPEAIFQLIGPTEKAGNSRYKCKLCIGSKSISASNKSRVNLRNHLKSQHTSRLKSFDEWCSSNDKRKRKTDSEDVEEIKASKLAQPTISGFMSQRRLTQSMLDTFVVEYIADCILPFNHVESAGFQLFTNRMLGNTSNQLKIKTRKVYKSQMKALFASKKELLIQNMRTANSVCLTADHWSCRRKGYIGITAHWYEKTGIKRRQACIALRRVEGRCTYDVIGRLMENVIAEFELSNKVSHCVTDSGSNFVKAFREYGTEAQIGDAEMDVEEVNDDDDVMHPVEIGDLLEEGPLEGMEIYDLPRHLRCAAHRMNLIATGNEVTSALGNPRCKTVYRALMGKLTVLWNKQGRSTVVSDAIKNAMGILFIAPNSTRWNSTYDALVRVKRMVTENKAELQGLLSSESQRPLSENEETFLSEFITVFRPLASALDVIQGENEACAGYLLPALKMLIEEWKEIEMSNDLVYCSGVLCALTSELNRRFETELKSSYFKVAAAIHPKFKLGWLTDPDEKADVREKVKLALQTAAEAASSPNDSSASVPITQSEPTEKSFFWRIEQRQRADTASSSTTSTLYDIWSTWSLGTRSDIPEELHDMFIQYNTTLPSSAPVERLFSLSKRVLTPSRSLLSDEAFEMCAFLPALKKAGF